MSNIYFSTSSAAAGCKVPAFERIANAWGDFQKSSVEERADEGFRKTLAFQLGLHQDDEVGKEEMFSLMDNLLKAKEIKIIPLDSGLNPNVYVVEADGCRKAFFKAGLKEGAMRLIARKIAFLFGLNDRVCTGVFCTWKFPSQNSLFSSGKDKDPLQIELWRKEGIEEIAPIFSEPKREESHLSSCGDDNEDLNEVGEWENDECWPDTVEDDGWGDDIDVEESDDEERSSQASLVERFSTQDLEEERCVYLPGIIMPIIKEKPFCQEEDVIPFEYLEMIIFTLLIGGRDMKDKDIVDNIFIDCDEYLAPYLDVSFESPKYNKLSASTHCPFIESKKYKKYLNMGITKEQVEKLNIILSKWDFLLLAKIADEPILYQDVISENLVKFNQQFTDEGGIIAEIKKTIDKEVKEQDSDKVFSKEQITTLMHRLVRLKDFIDNHLECMFSCLDLIKAIDPYWGLHYDVMTEKQRSRDVLLPRHFDSSPASEFVGRDSPFETGCTLIESPPKLSATPPVLI